MAKETLMKPIKIIVFILMVIAEIAGWHQYSQVIARHFVPENGPYTFIDNSTNCDELPVYVINKSDLPDYKKSHYTKAYHFLSGNDTRALNTLVRETEIQISREDAIHLKARQIMWMCIGFSFFALMLIAIFMNQLEAPPYLATPLSWIAIGIVALIYYFTAGRHKRKREAQEKFHHRMTQVVENFKSFNGIR